MTKRAFAARVALGLGFALGAAACPDAGLEPMQFCQETLSPSAGGTCSVEYVACPNAFTCSWRVDCTVSGGTTTCTCAATDPDAGCHIDRTFTTDAATCAAIGAGDRASARAAIFMPCLGTSPEDVDFSGISNAM
jgi:hypothetical protein